MLHALSLALAARVAPSCALAFHFASFDAQSGAIINLTKALQLGAKGAGAVVAVLDTGVDYRHATFGACKMAGAFGCTVLAEVDVTGENVTKDPDGHGTACAGLIAGKDHGVAPAARLVSVKVATWSPEQGEYVTSPAELVKGLEWVAQHRDVYGIDLVLIAASEHVANAAGSGCALASGAAVADGIAKLKAAGVAVFSAAGNDGDKGEGFGAPACLPDVVSVGAVYDFGTDPQFPVKYCSTPVLVESDHVACFSNSHPTLLDLLAPGALLDVPVPIGKQPETAFTGTSGAAAVAVGVAALLVSDAGFPEMSPDTLVTILKQSGQPVQDAQSGVTTPRVDASAALKLAANAKLGAGCTAKESPSADLDLDWLPDACDPDADGDGVAKPDDCDDLDPLRHPGAAEPCDGIDNDCDGKVDDGAADADQDGVADCVDPDDDNDGVTAEDGDCNDLSAAVSPLVAEACNGSDDDCDGDTDEDFLSSDGDAKADCIDEDDDNDGFPDAVDCHPLSAAAFPGAEELCNGIDDNCNGTADESFPDTDQDGVKDCQETDPDGDGVGGEQDCEPLVAAIYPGAPELCNGIDDDCDGELDEGYSDTDGDGIPDCLDDDIDGDGAGNAQDCNPMVATVFPGATETCNGVDDSCNGVVDEGFADLDGDELKSCLDPDEDGDGWLASDECDDLDASRNPGEVEACNGQDDDCDGATDEGFADQDADGIADCMDPDLDGDGVPTALDCAPYFDSVFPGSKEVCNGLDDNCNGSVDEGFPDLDLDGLADCKDDDQDGDGDWEWNDCDDHDPERAHDRLESCDGKDNDCDGEVDETFTDTDADGEADCLDLDMDGDGWLNVADCAPLSATEHPDAPEVCNGRDDNCRGDVDEGFSDLDGDGIADCVDGDQDGDGDPGTTDCDDHDPRKATTLAELCDGLDNTCDGAADEGFPDLDGDGVANCVDPDVDADGHANEVDCAPGDPTIHPGAVEQCNGRDENCNAAADEGFADTDGDGIADCEDPDDDNDGLPDDHERYGKNSKGFTSDPLLADSDGDGASDAKEVSKGTDPEDPESFPGHFRDSDDYTFQSGGCAVSPRGGHGWGWVLLMACAICRRRRAVGRAALIALVGMASLFAPFAAHAEYQPRFVGMNLSGGGLLVADGRPMPRGDVGVHVGWRFAWQPLEYAAPGRSTYPATTEEHAVDFAISTGIADGFSLDVLLHAPVHRRGNLNFGDVNTSGLGYLGIRGLWNLGDESHDFVDVSLSPYLLIGGGALGSQAARVEPSSGVDLSVRKGFAPGWVTLAVGIHHRGAAPLLHLDASGAARVATALGMRIDAANLELRTEVAMDVGVLGAQSGSFAGQLGGALAFYFTERWRLHASCYWGKGVLEGIAPVTALASLQFGVAP